MSRSGEEHTMTCHHPDRRVQTVAIQAACLMLMGCAALTATAAEADAPPIAQIRASNPAIGRLIREATEQSPTFRRIVVALEATDGIVYVEDGQCGHGVRACLKMWMQASGANRFLRVIVDRRKADSDLHVMGSIGHELQHTVEALSDPGITNGVKLYNYFRRLAPTDSNRFETTAAIKAGDLVQDELQHR
jgi:hypothetical protein